ncbi:MAG: DUF3427 domain-containing protein [Acidobacteria bacterium]|nr:DUF3427 domain-containing protein [Acidobacteriota bacterium]
MTQPLAPGLYERLITRELRRAIGAEGADNCRIDELPVEDGYVLVAEHLRRVIARALQAVSGRERVARQAELTNALIEWLQTKAETDAVDGQEDSLELPAEVLREVRRGLAFAPILPEPLIPLSATDLLVNGRGEPSVGAAIEREIHSADSIDLLCAFVRWNGLRPLQPALRAHCEAHRPLRVITTVYTGSTERRALDWLVSIGAKVKVSYDTRTTRLHAKAWLFERASGYSTAFIGSSNLTHSAMLDGVEWNIRLGQPANPEVLEKFRATFETYWAETSYETYDPSTDAARFDRAVSDTNATPLSLVASLDIPIWPHQQKMLEQLQVERERHGRFRNLVVAATGTGKTMVAAFDYRRLRRQLPRASLLFVAHRKEILQQSLLTYRTVMRDGSFGELYVDGHRPEHGRHIFASIQSLSQLRLDTLSPDEFDVVVVDEFHHAAAASYRRLLEHLRPKVLLGLTATPERTDGESVLHWFDNRIAVELRLWDALEENLLSPFHYFGLNDGTDLSTVSWSRRGYDVTALQNLYTADHRRVALVIQAIQDKVAKPQAMRALGFCVSVEHAQFMAREFNRRGLRAVAVDAGTNAVERADALRKLRDREVSVVFCVDLFNEGVDVPEVDTVLFLRPTESALVFLQQLGRGLRRTEDKSCLTVLDFIGNANRRFRYDLRFRALLGGSRSDLTRQVEEGFPRLPSGCVIQLDRVSSRIVLDNLRTSVGATFAGFIPELRRLADAWRATQRDANAITLGDFLKATDLRPEDLYRSNGWTWSRLRREAGLQTPSAGPNEEEVSRALQRLLHLDDPNRIALYARALDGELSEEETDDTTPAGRALLGLHYTLWSQTDSSSIRESLDRLRMHPAVVSELRQLLAVLEDSAEHLPVSLDSHMGWKHQIPLAVHARCTRDEVQSAFGALHPGRTARWREGVFFDRARNVDLFFVTLEKSEKHYSPSTRYRDYAISRDLFHWQSQWTTSIDSVTGRRYVTPGPDHHVVLFVRQRKAEGNRTAPYVCLGAADYVSHQGSRPISITWRLRKAMPEDLFLDAKVAVG